MPCVWRLSRDTRPVVWIHHSDRGSQYCSIGYQAVLRKHDLLILDEWKGQLLRPTSAPGRRRIFKTIKSELIWGESPGRPAAPWPSQRGG